jgi:hypothetical protein
VRRWLQRRRADQRARLAADARRVAGFADATIATARRLGADIPEGVGACTLVWRLWAWRLDEWAGRDA